MRILLTGRSGQVGGALAARLAMHEVWAPDRAQFDLTHIDAIADCVARAKPDLIVNCAAYTAVDAAEDDRATAHRINAEAPGALAAAAKAVGAGIVHFSTDYVFDGTATKPYREADSVAPLNAYGRSKQAGETAVRDAGVPHLILRTSWVYAAEGRNFLRTMLRLFAARETVAVVADQTGAPTPAGVIADTVSALIARMDGDPAAYLSRHGGLLHVTCRGRTTWHGFATAILEEARLHGWAVRARHVEEIATRDYPTKAARPAFSVLSLDRLEREFGLTTPDWRAALKQVMDSAGGEPGAAA